MQPDELIRLEDEIKAWLRETLSEERYTHIIGVYGMVGELATIHGLDDEPLRLAALFHDCAREMPIEQMREKATAWGIEMRPIYQDAPMLMHGPIAIEIARREWDLDDPAMVSAIRYHTSGHPEMSLSDMAFYLADGLEPSRDYPGISQLRAAARRDIVEAMVLLVSNTLAHLHRKGATIDPHTEALFDMLETSDAPRDTYR